jgi:tRNA-specific 2-thiouridylase
LGKPAFVTSIDPDTNTVVLGDEADLEKEAMRVVKVNWIKYDSLRLIPPQLPRFVIKTKAA